MPVLDARGIRRQYGVRTVLDGVSLTLDAGERIGIVGANGSGKTTLVRILAGVEEPDAGERVLRSGVQIAYLPQEPLFDGDPTALNAAVAGLSAWCEARDRYDAATQALADNGGQDAALEQQARAAADLERHGGWEVTHRAEAMLAHLGVTSATQRVSTMSGGERRRVDLARVLVAEPDIAILDEPTNHLDVETIEWLESHLRGMRSALLVITHDRVFLDRMVDRTAELSDGSLRIYDGGYEAFLEARAEREAQEARAERNRQNVMRRELDWLRRSAPARTSKQKARTQRAENLINQSGPAQRRDVALAVDTVRSGRTVLVLEDLKLAIEDRTLVDGLTLTLSPGERVGIVGPNGSGKTTLLRALLGEREPDGGRITRGKNAKITYLGQSREGLDESETVYENVAGGRSRVEVGSSTMDVRAYLERFLFTRDQARQPVSTLSGGEKARVLLAKLLLTPSNLLVLDEPTNDLDVSTLAALEEMLVELKGTALVVTHDRWFLDRVATSILAFEGDGRVVRYPGGYTSYRTLRDAARAQEPEEAPPPASPSAPVRVSDAPKKKALTYGEEIELEGLLDRVGEAEETVSALEAKLADPALYEGDRAEEAARVATDLEAARAELAKRVARWEELETKAAG
ncbi:MAG: ABC-F family ATP-binding cassette domain-containing protein [Sandaracinaceae bacterium]